MKIRVNSIPPQGCRLKESVDSKSWDLDSEDLRYVGDISLEGSFYKEHNTVRAHVTVNSCREFSCSRCLEACFQDVKEVYRVKPSYLGKYVERLKLSDEDFAWEVTDKKVPGASVEKNEKSYPMCAYNC